MQTVSPDYRLPLWRLLGDMCNGRIAIYAGDDYFKPAVRTPPAAQGLISPVKNWFLFRRSLLIQRIPLRRLMRSAAVIVEDNPRILSTWLLLLLRRCRGRPTLLWGHVRSREGHDKSYRRVMRRLGSGYVCYTESDARELASSGYRGAIVAAPNALARRDMISARPGHEAKSFVYVGRLVAEKKPRLLLTAFLIAASQLPEDCNLVFVGDGPEGDALRADAAASEFASRVEFLGHISAWDRLSEIYSRSLAAVSPGYVGLSIIQAHSFGVPAVVADREPHAPEYEAVIPGANAVLFAAGSVAALAASLQGVSSDREAWVSRSDMIAEECRRRYSLESQASALAMALGGGAQPGQRRHGRG